MHIVWDWNGTLLSDIDAVVAAANAQFALFGAREMTLEHYRSSFARPVRAFNETHIGRELTDGEWTALDAGFHQVYWGRVADAPLADDAVAALERVARLGWSQSLLSMAPHHHVTEIVAERGLAPHFRRIDGNLGEVGAAKEANLRAHLAALDVPVAQTWLVGDAVDDAVAAHAVGARAVLVARASCHARDVLAATGAPVADTIAEAVDMVVQASDPPPVAHH